MLPTDPRAAATGVARGGAGTLEAAGHSMICTEAASLDRRDRSARRVPRLGGRGSPRRAARGRRPRQGVAQARAGRGRASDARAPVGAADGRAVPVRPAGRSARRLPARPGPPCGRARDRPVTETPGAPATDTPAGPRMRWPGVHCAATAAEAVGRGRVRRGVARLTPARPRGRREADPPGAVRRPQLRPALRAGGADGARLEHPHVVPLYDTGGTARRRTS